ncbi:helix-turn-helix domain-containing protein [Ammoniphilus sp. YIM 78166]|uniref:helix-turn-helix domain-containing protein n=1 Tax=Ammoniphilus sp. YIM 78166 TaxID=1644106 RepID=UPI00106FEB5E|nr:helix-turn-helix transcriptional regulator [Ammoniphilus sp. YIM 78166]
MSIVGKKIRSERSKRKWKQEEVGNFLGVSGSAIGMYERGERSPDNEMLKKFADLFEVSIDYLLGRTNDPTPPQDGDEPPLSPKEEQEWLNIAKELSKDESMFFYQFHKAPNKKKRQLIKYWEHILMDDEDE